MVAVFGCYTMQLVLWPNAPIIGGWAVFFNSRKYIFNYILYIIIWCLLEHCLFYCSSWKIIFSYKMGEATWRDYISIIILGPWFRTCHFESRNCALKDLNTHSGKLDNGKKSIWNIIIWRKPKFLALSWNHLNTNHILFRHLWKSF